MWKGLRSGPWVRVALARDRLQFPGSQLAGKEQRGLCHRWVGDPPELPPGYRSFGRPQGDSSDSWNGGRGFRGPFRALHAVFFFCHQTWWTQKAVPYSLCWDLVLVPRGKPVMFCSFCCLAPCLMEVGTNQNKCFLIFETLVLDFISLCFGSVSLTQNLSESSTWGARLPFSAWISFSGELPLQLLNNQLGGHESRSPLLPSPRWGGVHLLRGVSFVGNRHPLTLYNSAQYATTHMAAHLNGKLPQNGRA